MANQKTITLKKANKVFPEKYTRVRAHDLTSISQTKKNFLSKKEQIKLQNIADDIRQGLFGSNRDVIIQRKGKKLIIKKF